MTIALVERGKDSTSVRTRTAMFFVRLLNSSSSTQEILPRSTIGRPNPKSKIQNLKSALPPTIMHPHPLFGRAPDLILDRFRHQRCQRDRVIVAFQFHRLAEAGQVRAVVPALDEDGDGARTGADGDPCRTDGRRSRPSEEGDLDALHPDALVDQKTEDAVAKGVDEVTAGTG